MLPSRVGARCALLCVLVPAAFGQSVSDPHITSWVTSKSAQYARIYETSSAKTSGTSVTTWPSSGLTNNGGGVSTPAYSDVQRVAYSANYVYIYTTGLASYVMGNWLTPNGQVYQSWPANRAAIHRIPRNPTIPTTKQKNNGNGGVLVNGVYVWQNGDAQSYVNASSTSTTAVISMQGDGIWNRLAGVAETFNFDPANGHQPSSGAYHNHINPKALRYQLGDNVTYDSSSKTYSESGTPTKHSPIIGWANDGLPIYGPYGYSSPMDSTSGVRRMTTGFVKRDSTNATLYGTDDLAVTGRVKLPVWAASVQGRNQTLSSSQYGPSTTATYALGPVNKTCVVGTFAEDYEYLGDLGKTQGVDFDLNRQNVRYCVTPEYPSGTYAYFVCIDSTGNTVFPDVINQEYFGSAAPGTGTVTSITESVTEYVDAGPAATIKVTAAASGANIGLSWNSAEGATYKVESSPDNATWTTLSSTVTSGGLSTSYTATTTANYYRVTLSAIATYDSGGTYGAPVGKTGTAQFGTTAAPTIATQPIAATVTAGTSVTFTVVANGSGLTYQWKKGGAAISGATNASYTIASPQTADAGSYSVTASNTAGSVTSDAVTLTVNSATTTPAITTQPAAQTVTAGASVTFTVVATGTAPLTYQWSKGGTAISGATAASYSIATAQAGDAGTYTVAVTNATGSATSSGATLTVTGAAVAPSITSQPANTTATTGGSAIFSVTASGAAPLTYQWQKGGAAIVGATASSLTLANVQAADAASYTCVVTNGTGSVTSTAATLTVTTSAVAPTIASQPASVTAAAGGSVSFSVVANGTAPLTYQWQKNGAVISGGTTPNLNLPNVQAADAASYTCVVSNSVGSLTSSPAVLTVNATTTPGSITITAQPMPATVTAGGSVSFSVAATGTGTGTLSYQWQKNGTAINGATGATYALASVQTADAATYTAVVTGGGVSVTSAGATLTVNPSPQPAGIINLAVRTRVGGTAGTPITGFVLAGSGTGKRIVVRAVGPTLADFGVSGALSDPQLQLWSGSKVVGSNDNWTTTDGAAMSAVGAFPLKSGSADAAIVTTLAAGGYTTPVSAGGNGNGIVLIECYDGATTDGSVRLVNASARAFVGTGDDVLIPGFVISGDGTVRVLIRAVGPTLGTFGVPGVLADPQLAVFQGTTVVGVNNDWQAAPNAPQVAAAAASAGAFPLLSSSADAALLIDLPAGAYTAKVSGVGDTTGTALVEVYVIQK